MKRFATLAASLCVFGCATPGAADHEPLSLTAIHDVPGKTGPEICRQARDWAALNLRDSKAVIEVFDLEQGKLIGKGGMSVPGPTGLPNHLGFSLQVDCKDGKVRTTFSQFVLKSQGGEAPLQEGDPLNILRSRTEAKTRAMDADLANHLLNARASW